MKNKKMGVSAKEKEKGGFFSSVFRERDIDRERGVSVQPFVMHGVLGKTVAKVARMVLCLDS